MHAMVLFSDIRVRSILRNCGTEDACTVSHTTTSTTDNRRDETQSPANQQANEGMIPDPDHDAMKDAIPYIGYFRYKNGKMSCNITCKDTHIKNLETYCVV